MHLKAGGYTSKMLPSHVASLLATELLECPYDSWIARSARSKRREARRKLHCLVTQSPRLHTITSTLWYLLEVSH